MGPLRTMIGAVARVRGTGTSGLFGSFPETVYHGACGRPARAPHRPLPTAVHSSPGARAP
ncbi:hypothetical protein GCM10018793_13750 [Streptomyces sulfonofaciens]|uniref:Uncharacterized protein n=1 Tax=Streptomyces sulfonofaciens TaxID=68272 RepID=A0A919FXV9_9ACTN|nr:hypothetical protein GCM10018793_13750 [Streptomyces sulfonofaciens]